MTGPADPDLPGGWEAAAAEYVLGLMPEAERRAFEERLARDADLRQDVAAWETYFATLADGLEEIAPPPGVLRRVESRIFPTPRRALWRQLLPYALGAAAAALVAWLAVATDLVQPPGPVFTAELSPVEGQIALTARFDPDAGVLAVERRAGAVPEGRVLELWLIDRAAGAPVSLGLLSGTGETVLELPPSLAERLPGATLAVSEEPAGGSPTGAPSGPVRAAGEVAAL